MDPTSTRVKWQHFYDSAFWRRRRKLQLKQHPICKLCLTRSIISRATVADHVEPHRGDWNKFCLGELQSLCSECHNREKKLIEGRGYGTAVDDDGWPTDPRHPANRMRR